MTTRPSLAPLTHQPALDGLRGIAILAVLAFHLGVFAPGFLGVDLFFVLSGFLITRLLLTRLAGGGRVGLGSFWAGRLRRLLPAALVTIAAVAVLGVIGVFASPTLRADLGAALAYVANWRLVVSGDDYADQFGPASPVRHFWSLAVEEQFYLVWPLVMAATAFVARRRGWPFGRLVLGIAVVLSAASAVLLWRLYDPAAISRAYYGTDSRMFGPLIGVALAVITAHRPGTRRSWRAPELAVLLVALVAGLAVIGSWTVTSEAYYHGGAVLFAVGVAVLIALALVRPMVPLAWRPLCWVGAISYGLYLYHWPIFAVLTPDRTGWSDPWLAVARLGVTFAAAAASAVWLERPIRAGRLPARVAPVALAVGIGVAVVAVLVVPVPAPLVDLTPIDLAAGPPSPPPPPPTGAAGAGGLSSPATLAEVAARPANAPIGPVGFSLGDIDRSIAVGVTADADGAAAPTAAVAPATATTPSTTAPITGTSERPLRIMVVGDSVGNNIGTGLDRWSAGRSDVVTWNRAMVGCGFELDAEIVGAPQSDPTCRDWLDRFGQYVDQFAPDVVLVVVGRGDQAQRTMPAWGRTERVGDPEFDDLMGTAYDRVLSTLERSGTRVVIGTYPCLDEIWVYQDQPGPDGRRGNETNAAFNSFLRGLGRPMIDLERRVCPGGTFSSTVEGVAGARPDGFHLTDEATTALAPWLVDELRRVR